MQPNFYHNRGSQVFPNLVTAYVLISSPAAPHSSLELFWAFQQISSSTTCLLRCPPTGMLIKFSQCEFSQENAACVLYCSHTEVAVPGRRGGTPHQ